MIQTLFRFGSGVNTVDYSGPRQTLTVVELEIHGLYQRGFPGARKLA